MYTEIGNRAPNEMREDRQKRMKLLIAATVFGIVILAGGYLSRDHWWIRKPGARVTLNGQVSPDARVYRAYDGTVDVFISEEREGTLRSETYTIYPASMFPTSNHICLPGGAGFYTLGPVAFYRYLPPGNCAGYVMADPIKQPEVEYRPNGVEFNSGKGTRVVATW